MVTRRQFLRLSVAGAAACAAGCMGQAGRKTESESPATPVRQEAGRVEGERKMKPNAYTKDGLALVSKVKAGDIKESVLASVGLLGGFERIVEKGDTITIKPNFNSTDPPPASSDPEFLRAIVECLKEHGAGRVIIAESCGPGLKARDVLTQTGIVSMAREAGAEVLFLDESPHSSVKVQGTYAGTVNFARHYLEAEKIVYAPCMKTHQYASFTLSLKLTVGMLDSEDKLGLHASRLEDRIAELNTVVAPDLIIMDGRKCFKTGGPWSGDVENPGLILASADRIALDVEALRVIGSFAGTVITRNPWEYRQIKRAVELGLGARSESDYLVVEG